MPTKTKKSAPAVIEAKHPSREKGKLRSIGGSASDAFNNTLANQVVRTLWLDYADKAEIDKLRSAAVAGLIGIESIQNRGVIRLFLAVPGHHSQAGSPDSVDGRRPQVCRSARRCARRGSAAPSLCSSASAASCSGAWPRSR